jgi:hypothetical protein
MAISDDSAGTNLANPSRFVLFNQAGALHNMNNIDKSHFVLSKPVFYIANIIFILSIIGIIVYSFIVPLFGLSWGWIVIPMLPIWAVIMANLSPG